MSLKRNFKWLLTSKIILMALLFVAGAMINRSLGPGGRGILAEMQTWIGLFSVIFNFSLDSAIYHFANRERYGNDDNSRFITVFVLSAIYSILAIFFMTLFVILFPSQVSREMVSLIAFLDILLIATMITTNLTVLLQAIKNIRFAAILNIIQGGTNFTLITIFYLTKHLTLFFILIALIAVQAGGMCIIGSKLFKFHKIKDAFSWKMAIGMIQAGFKQHIATISTFVYTKINQLIVFRYSGESEAGIFAVALNLAFSLMFIPGTFQQVLYPRVIHYQDDYKITVRSMRVGFYGWGIVVAIIILCAKPLLLLYGGSKFQASVNIFRIVIVATWILSLSSLVAPYYVKMGSFSIASLLALILASISIALNFALVPLYASIGAALATVLTCFIGFCMTLGFFYYLSGKNPFIIFSLDFLIRKG